MTDTPDEPNETEIGAMAHAYYALRRLDPGMQQRALREIAEWLDRDNPTVMGSEGR